MVELKQDLAYEDPSKTFIGVRFVLFGFNSIGKDKTWAKLLEGGGFDAGDYGPDCTHVIVDKLIYDDPLCITARRDGKTLVTAPWVDHSFDVGMPVDPTSVMYRPLRDLNGIPGAKSLVVCLTGYQRQDRDDIMTMVGLMGANFSKPLIANKVTHLICYKFEGDKYELAKKMKKIKLVNHRWLENCLKTWEILPEADYDKSGYELEMMEAEAKDSEEETEDVAAKNDVERKSIANPQNTQAKSKNPHQSLMQEASKNNLDSFASKSSTNVGNINEDLSNAGKETKFDNVPAGNFLQEIPNCHPEMSASGNNVCPGKILSSLPSNIFDDKMIFEEADNDAALMSKSAKKSPHSSTSKSTGKSYSRRSPGKSRLLLCSERIDSNAGNPSTANKLGCDVNLSSLEEEQVEAGFDGMVTPSSGTMLHLDKGENSLLHDKRKMTISYGSSKSLKTSPDSETILEDKSVMKRTDKSSSGSLINGSCRMGSHVSPENSTGYMGESMKLNFTDVTEVVTSVTRQECSDIAHLSSLYELECRTLTSDLEAKDLSLSKTEHPIAQIVVQQSNLQTIDTPSPGTKISEVKKSSDQAQLELLKRGDSAPKSKTLGRRKLSKKTLGSRTCLSKGNATKPKDSIEIPKTLLQNDSVIRSIEEIEMEEYEKFASSKKLDISPPTSSVRMGQRTEMNNLGISGNETINKDGSMDDQTEDSKDKEENKYDAALDKEKSAEIEAQQLENMCTDKRVGVNDSSKQTDGSIIGAMAKAENIRKEDKGIEAEMAVSSKENEICESKLVQHGREKNLTKGKKRPLNKTKRTVATDVGNLNEIGRKDGCNNKPIKEKTTAQNEKTSPSAGKTKACPSKKSKNLTEVEKENSHFVMRSQNISSDKNFVGKVMPKSSKTPLKDSKAANADMNLARVEQILKVKTEPIWFILSGHKLQRKEFQQVIKCLKGRVCRDSHTWSYQATHFIVPDPVRRTEKFFAAAASGSWILKTDYLTASNEAGRFLLEEPYEWHKKCLTEDGAINLEAPRKWRLVKERTGHGAFYGMRIIIYGECIAPPLETLKRVIKAGDGTILATSPPYTRFLQSSVDFAIVSPGMLRVDMWIQEFLRHEIPCVLADYLVEYVCKPGYSLERHVQYNTHVWAEKSFNNLVNRMEEVVQDARRSQH